ncbi:MAG: phenylalanine--tRNA ligase subunit alpha [Nanoarchaeota archaeon]|nr:phenylalanine--tRNA ligase subunit alpha [Nanoarchaeota archaeon]MBU0963178.1 phenylalanine--tRNA ligase subunit alpha [Nanoarchaeota archaeon]
MVIDLSDSLSPLERKVLKVLKDHKKISEIEAASKLSNTEVLRSLQFLENKKIVKLNKREKDVILLDKNGLKYTREKLPERRFLESIKNNTLTLDEIKEKSKLNDDEIKASIGVLKGKLAIDFSNNKISITAQGKEILNKETYEEYFLNRLSKETLTLKELSDKEKYALNELKKRKDILKIEKIKEMDVELTEQGKSLSNKNLNNNLIETLNTEILKSGSWKNKKFRRYDINSGLPRIYGGKRHFVNESRSYIKKIWLDMGFKEMTGNLVQPCFWNFDALFVPQDHPAREMQDTFFVEGKANLNNNIISRVKETHENGWTTNSKGWGYKWNIEEAQKLVLRTHTTVLSARTLASLKESDLPAKFFAVGKVFRNETLDWKHSFEFLQSEGIVIDENVNLRNLIGYLKEFFSKMGFDKIRVKPSFFPYTHCSAEIEVYHPERKEWVELGGAGIFRPEVTKPLLGFECPVLAWGLGVDRIIVDKYQIKDIRELHKNDLKQLKEIKTFIK